MRSFILAAVSLASVAIAQTPGNFSPAISGPLDVEYAETIVTPGKVLGGRVPQNPPTIGSKTFLNGSYLLAMVDFDNQANLGLLPGNPQPLIGSYLHWLQPNIKFSSIPRAVQPANPNTSTIYIADTFEKPTVPYLAPQAANSSKEDGHRYVFILWPEIQTFVAPANFPYNNTFRLAFNASRIASEGITGEPILADWFTYEANATKTCGGSYSLGTATATNYKGKSGPTPFKAYRWV